MKYKEIKYLANKLNAEGSKKRFVGFTKTFAFISIFLGSAALIIALSVLDGFENELRKTAVKFTSHIQLMGFDSRPIVDFKQKTEHLKNTFSEIKGALPSVSKEAMIRGKKGIEGILLKGVIYDSVENASFRIKNNIIKGKADLSKGSIIIGRALAEKIGAEIGDKVLIYSFDMSMGNNFVPKYKQFKVTGVYETGMMKYDANLSFINFTEAQKLAGLEKNNSSNIDILINDYNAAPALSLLIDDEIGFPYYTLTVFDLHSPIFAWIELQKEPIPLVLGLITLVAVLNIITSMLVLIVEKTYSIGILRSLGIKNNDLLKIFLLKGMKIGVSGTILGSLTAYILLTIQKYFGLIRLKGEIYFLTTAPVDISLWHYELVIGISILLTFIVTLVPALITLKISPLKAISFR